MHSLDYLAIGFYSAFMLLVGVVFARKNKDSSDFFRAGGSLTWWLVGASAFVTLFSAWTFVGCAGRVFRSGTSTSLVFIFNVLALIITYYLAPRFRRLRVISWVEAVRLRFGSVSEQFFSYATSLVGLLFGGTALYTIAVFLSPVFNIPTTPIIIGVSVLIMVMSTFGGALAVIASDFIQSLFIAAVAIVVAILVLAMPSIGGMAGLIEKAPEHVFDWTVAMRPEVLGLWAIALLINQVVSANSMYLGAARYLAVRDERHARLAVLFPMLGMVVLPVIAFIPPIATSILVPDLAAQYPYLNNPSEASYIAAALMVLPPGMTGMLVCAIFAATLTSLNSALSVKASVLTRNVYYVLWRPQATERELLWIGRASTVLLGVVMLAIGLGFQSLKDLPLFELTLALAGLLGMPMTVPLLLGLFIRRSPDWSGWGTVLFGTAISSLCWFGFPVTWLEGIFGAESGLTTQELGDVRFAFTLIVATLASVLFFLVSCCFDTMEEPTERSDFFNRMKTPIQAREIVGDTVGQQAILIGQLGFVYGTGVAAFALVAKDWVSTLPFLASGGVVLVVSLVLFGVGKHEES